MIFTITLFKITTLPHNPNLLNILYFLFSIKPIKVTTDILYNLRF